MGLWFLPKMCSNYDETNLSDDPGVKKCIFKRGIKYAERICDTSKASTSIMFCGSATGQVLPPYVVYKAKHLYPTWMEGGPEGTRYNRSKSGWFDATIFADWFSTMFVPYVRKMKLKGKVVIIGDNLSSHFSEEVLNLCKNNNIAFVCLPTNSTHMTQPLDVAFYAPLKKSWRGILDKWKTTKQKKCQTVTKESFPGLLNKLHTHVTAGGTSSKNLVAGFKKCGIYPLNSSEVIDRLPKYKDADDQISENVSKAVIEMLQDLRTGFSTDKKTRRQKINIEAGKSVSLEDIQRSQPADKLSNLDKKNCPENEDSDWDEVDNQDNQVELSPNDVKKAVKRKSSDQNKKPKSKKSKKARKKTVKSKKKTAQVRKKLPRNAKSLQQMEDIYNPSNSSDCTEDTELDTNSHSSDQELSSQPVPGPSFVSKVRESDFIVVEFYLITTKRYKYFIAEVCKLNPDFYTVVFLHNRGSKFVRPDFMDERHILPTQIRRVLTAPVRKGSSLIFKDTEISSFNFN